MHFRNTCRRRAVDRAEVPRNLRLDEVLPAGLAGGAAGPAPETAHPPTAVGTPAGARRCVCGCSPINVAKPEHNTVICDSALVLLSSQH
jgi:hypothetical protein